MSDDAAPRETPALDNGSAAAENARVAAAGRQRATHMGFLRVLATIVFLIALPAALITTNIRLLANSPLTYDYSFDRYDAEASTGLSRDDLDGTAAELRRYFNNDEDAFYHTVTEGGLPVGVFNARETSHMADVKDLFVWVNRLQEASAVYVLVYVGVLFVWARDGSVRQLAVQSLLALGVGVIVAGGVGIFAAVGFDAAFTRFHDLFFASGSWTFDPDTDHLIQMFPEPFWRDITIFLGLMCAAEALIIAAAATVYLLGTRPSRHRLPASIEMEGAGIQAA